MKNENKRKEKKSSTNLCCSGAAEWVRCGAHGPIVRPCARMAHDERPRNWICGFGPSFHQSLGPHRHIYRVLETEWSDSIIRKLL